MDKLETAKDRAEFVIGKIAFGNVSTTREAELEERVRSLLETLKSNNEINQMLGARAKEAEAEVEFLDEKLGEAEKRIEELEEAIKLQTDLNVKKFEEAIRNTPEVEKEKKSLIAGTFGLKAMVLDLEEEVERLRKAIIKTLYDNQHLADGDNCTLIELKRVLGML